jgi:pimeloyl-ACP methyl ester carboxylesterase
MQVAKVAPTRSFPASAPNEERPSRVREPIEPILLIHGTDANRRTGDGADWWHPGSDFCHDLDALLQKRSAPARCWANLGIRKDPFAWTGTNSEEARQKAGKALAAILDALERDDNVKLYHVVGHSHGGNVIVNALSTMLLKPCKLGAVIFLGTPVLRFRHSVFDERLFLIPAYLSVIALAVFEILQPGDTQFFWWMPVIIYVTLVLLDELLGPRPPGPRSDAELYEGGRASAFQFDGDEAIFWLRQAEKAMRDPKRLIDQFLEPKAQKEFAFHPTSAPTSTRQTSVERVRGRLKNWTEPSTALNTLGEASSATVPSVEVLGKAAVRFTSSFPLSKEIGEQIAGT